MSSGEIDYVKLITISKASTTLSLDLYPLPHLSLQGHEMEIPRPLMVITLELHLFHISHLILSEI